MKITEIQKSNFLTLIETAQSIPACQLKLSKYLDDRGCKTVGCLVGWYVHMNPDCGFTIVPGGVPRYNISNNSASAADLGTDHFGMKIDDVELFYPSSYIGIPTKDEIMDRLKTAYKNATGEECPL